MLSALRPSKCSSNFYLLCAMVQLADPGWGVIGIQYRSVPCMDLDGIPPPLKKCSPKCLPPKPKVSGAEAATTNDGLAGDSGMWWLVFISDRMPIVWMLQLTVTEQMFVLLSVEFDTKSAHFWLPLITEYSRSICCMTEIINSWTTPLGLLAFSFLGLLMVEPRES